MKCPACGHARERHHPDSIFGCSEAIGSSSGAWDFCECKMSLGELYEMELNAWKAEAMAARRLLKLSKVHTQYFGMYCGYCERRFDVDHLETCKYYQAAQAYEKAIVKEG